MVWAGRTDGGAPAGGEHLVSGYTGRMFLALTLGLAIVTLGRRTLPPLLPAVIAGLEVATSPALAIAGVVVYALGMTAFPPSMQAHLKDAFPDDHMGGDQGATRTVYLGLGSLGPAYVGYVAGQVNYTLAFAGFIGCILCAGAIGALLLLGQDR